MPYARQRQQDNDNNLQGKLIKASSVAQVLSEVRAIEQDVYERNASTGRPYSAPKARAPRIPPLKILEQPEKNNYLPHTEANEEPDDYTYAAVAPHHMGRLKALKERRRVHHLTRVDEYHKLRLRIDMDIENKVGQVCAEMKMNADASEEEIKRLFGTLADKFLGPLSESQLEAVKDAVQQEFKTQQKDVLVLEEGLMAIEEKRSELVAAAIRESVSALYEIAYQLPDAIERIFQPEVKELNVHIIRNRGSYQELLARIGVSVVKRQEQAKEQYRERKARWRTLRHIHTVGAYKVLVQTDEFIKPQRRRELLNQLMEEMLIFQKVGVKQIKDLLQMIPPYIESKQVQAFNEMIQDAYLKADVETDKCIHDMTKFEDQLFARQGDLTRELAQDLVAIGAKSEEEVQEEIKANCFPLCEARHTYVQELIESTGTAMYGEQQRFMKKLDRFGNFYSRAANIWEAYIKEVSECNDNVVETLAVRGDKYDDDRKNLEERLTESLGELARQPDFVSLNMMLEKCRELAGPAGLIEENHRGYCRESVEMSKAFPPELSALIRGHMALMAKQFGLQTKEVFEEQTEQRLLAEAGASTPTSEHSGKGGKKSVEPAVSEQDGEQQEKQKRVALEMAPKIVVSGVMFVVTQDFSELCQILLHGTEEDIEAERVAAAKEAGAEEVAVEEEAEEVVVDSKAKAKPKAEKKKSKKELEEEARLAAEEAEAAQIEEDRKRAEAAELERKRNAVPIDTDGEPCIRRMVLKEDIILDQLPSIRHAFVKQSTDYGQKNRDNSVDFSKTRVKEYTQELHLTLRKHRPRFARVEIDVYDPRRQQLETNGDRFKRLELRLVKAVQGEDNAFQMLLADSKYELAMFVEDIAALRVKVDEGHSLASLNTVSKNAKLSKQSLVQSYQEKAFKLHGFIDELVQSSENANQDFLEGCLLIGSHERGVYAVQEVKSYKDLVERMRQSIKDILDAQRLSLDELETTATETQDLSAFEDNFREAVEELSVMEGLGHKYGAPKRNMTMTIRSEFAKNEIESKKIEDLFQLCVSACKANARIVASNGLEGPELPVLTEESNTVTYKILTALEELRGKLQERANYLNVMRPDLKPEGMGIVMKKIAAMPILREDLLFPPEQEEGEAAVEEDPKGKGKGAKDKGKDKKVDKKAGKDAFVAAEVEENPAGSFLAVVLEADVTCRREMSELYKVYDAAHPERRKVPEGGEPPVSARGAAKGKSKEVAAPPVDLPEAIDLHCKHEIAGAERRRKQYIAVLRAQVDAVAPFLSECSRLVLADVVHRCRRKATFESARLEMSFEKDLLSYGDTLRKHLSKLKPALGNVAKETMRTLLTEEEERRASVRSRINLHRQSMLGLEHGISVEYVHRAVHASKNMARLNDTFLYTTDLEEDPDVVVGDRPPLAGLVREYQRAEKERLEGAQYPNGYRFAEGTWPGVRTDEVVVDPVLMGKVAVVAEAEPPDTALSKKGDRGKKSKGKEAVKAVEVVEVKDVGCSPDLVALKTAPNRVAVSMRNACHAKYTELFQQRTSAVIETTRILESEEDGKEASWALKVTSLMKEC